MKRQILAGLLLALLVGGLTLGLYGQGFLGLLARFTALPLAEQARLAGLVSLSTGLFLLAGLSWRQHLLRLSRRRLAERNSRLDSRLDCRFNDGAPAR
jgi:hypothetical protein